MSIKLHTCQEAGNGVSCAACDDIRLAASRSAPAAALVERAKPRPFVDRENLCDCGKNPTASLCHDCIIAEYQAEHAECATCCPSPPAVAVRAQAQEPLEALIATWRKKIDESMKGAANGSWSPAYTDGLNACANELEAVLRSLRSDREREAE